MMSILNTALITISNPNVLLSFTGISALIVGIATFQFHKDNPLKVTLRKPASEDTWNSWALPLTTVGGVFGITLVVHSDQTFADLSLFFAALLLIAPFIYTMTPSISSQKFVGSLGTLLTSTCTLWAVMGELLATFVLIGTFSSFLLIILFRTLLIVTVSLVVIYYWQSKCVTDKTAKAAHKKPVAKKHVGHKDEGKREQEEQEMVQVAA
jgi:uncharacterized membrane protein